MTSIPVPDDLRTERLYLRTWRTSDAPRLLPILEANVDHLGSWIPAHVAAPAPLPDLERRLSEFAQDFAAARSWRYAIFSPGETELFGEVSLFPRSATARVELAEADRLEIGYWLRRDVTGRGYATEAACAMLELSVALPGIAQVEIHCDSRNVSSAAVPQRLGFRLRAADDPAAMPPHEAASMLWVYGAPDAFLPVTEA
ncbi:MAG: GNAT family N-acetyltransferase [Planctomycetaceae bacterium]